MRRFTIAFMWFTVGILLAMAFMEVLLSRLPVDTGLPRTGNYERWPLQNTAPYLPYTYSISWSMRNPHGGVTNNYGHVSPFDYQSDSHPIIVIGDSFVESLMNDYGDTLQGQLGRKLGDPRRVYGLGVSGLSASDYVQLSRMARTEFHPEAAIFVLSDGDLSESLIRQQGSYFLVPDSKGLTLEYDPVRIDPAGSRLRRALADSSIHRYFQINLQFSLDALWRSHSDGVVKAAASPSTDVDAQRKVADWFLNELPSSLGLAPQCIALLLDSDRYAIYKPESATRRKDDPATRAYLIERARQLGFEVSDLGPIFARDYARSHVKFDYWPIDRHWNSVGHGVAAEEAYRLLLQPEPGGKSQCLRDGAGKGPRHES